MVMEQAENKPAGGGAKSGVPASTKRKRKSRQNHRLPADFLFPLSLAALNHPQHPSSTPLIKMCFDQFTCHLPDAHLLHSILALLPLIFSSRCSDIVRIGLNIFGAAALISYEVNEKIALQEANTLKLLLPKILCGTDKVAFAACNALLDLSSTSLGRQRLVDFSAINHLMS